jgi:cell division transport system permease protein
MWGWAWGQAIASIRRAPGIFAGSVAAIGLVLLLAGLGLAGRAAVAFWQRQLQQQAVVTVFLRPNPPPAVVRADAERLRQLPGVAAVAVISPAQALAQMRLSLGRDAAVLNQLGGVNPFVGYLAVSVEPQQAPALARVATGLPAVAVVRDNRRLMERLARLEAGGAAAALALAALAMAVGLVVVSHVVRLSLWQRREELETLRWMGASFAMMALPFGLEAVVVGLGGGLLAAGMLGAAVALAEDWASRALPFVGWPSWGGLAGVTLPAVAAMGALCGLLGAGWVLRTLHEE